MKCFARGMVERQIKTRLRTVPISSVRCEKKTAGIQEGWGGEHIESFPPFSFFKLFNDGEEEKAVSDMEAWYYERMVDRQLIAKPKCEGGMEGGSLFREISRMHNAKGLTLNPDLSNADVSLLHQAIALRVQQRLFLFQSIRLHGQRFSWDYVRMIADGQLFTLLDGHHRVAALAVCGFSNVLAAVPESAPLKLLRRIGILFSQTQN